MRWDHENTMIWCIVYHHHLISNKPWQYFHSCFFSFLCSRKVSRATHFSPEHSMVNNLRGAKGQWKWPSILDTPSSSKSLWLYDDEQKKLKKENRRRPPKKRRKSEAEKSLPGLFILFFPLSLDCRLFFILCILSKIPKKIVSKWWRIVVRPAPNTFCVCSTLYSL